MSNFKAKMRQYRLPLGLCLDPSGKAYSAPRPPSWNKGDLLLREGEGKEYRKGKGGGEEER